MTQTPIAAVAVILLIGTMTGCSSVPPWQHATKDRADLRRDYVQCTNEAERATLDAVGQTRSTYTPGDDSDPMALKDRSVAEAAFKARLNACMVARGYYRESSS